jgi:hypothetical protein
MRLRLQEEDWFLSLFGGCEVIISVGICASK